MSAQKGKFVYFSVLAYCALVLTGLLAVFITDARLVGWDLYPQYYLVDLMVRNLQSGSFRAYDPNWFAGYPSFTFYGPLPYAAVALIHLASFKYISTALALNLVMLVIPFLFAAAVFSFVKEYLGDRGRIWSVIFIFFYLTFPSSPHHGPFGIFGSLQHGHFAAFFSMIFFALLLSVIERQRSSPSAFNAVKGALLLAAVIYSHLIIAVFAVLYAGICIISSQRKLRRAMSAIILGGLAISLPLWLPLMLNLNLSSGEIQTVSVDPLISLFPDLPSLKRCAQKFPHRLPFGFMLCSLTVLVCLIVGIAALMAERKYFLPAVFLGALVFLPRNFFPDILTFGLHYNRFLFPMIPFLVVLAARGAVTIAHSIGTLRLRLARLSSGAALAAIVGWALLCSGIQNYTVYPWSSIKGTVFFESGFYACDSRNLATPLMREEEIPVLNATRELSDYLAALKSPGRIAVQSAHADVNLLGTPHFLSTWLPLKYGIPVANGLLAESSPSTEYIVPVFAFLTRGMSWARNRIYPMFDKRPAPDSLIKRLALYNIEYLVLTDRTFLTNYLGQLGVPEGMSPEQVIENFETRNRQVMEYVRSFEPFHVFKVTNPRPYVYALDYKPYLFVSQGGMDFREFAEEWFQSDLLLEFPVIHTKKSYFELPERERQGIGGIILNYFPGTVLGERDLQPWIETGKNIILINGEIDPSLSNVLGIKSLSTFSKERFVVDLARLIALPEVSSAKIEADLSVPGSITFVHRGGAVVNFSYFPWWHAIGGATLFQITPSQMFLFADGETRLTYSAGLF